MAKKHGKKYLEAAKLVDPTRLYEPREAIELAKQFADEEAKRFINGILDHVLNADPRLEGKRDELAKKVD
ncbi:MAG: hypothetical protein C4294_08330 [Nitrospiraceae bacterium]